VVWDDYFYSSGNYEIIYKLSTDGGASWATERLLTNDPNVSWHPSIFVSASNIHVVWQDNRDGNREIYYKRSTNRGASWSSDIRLTNNPSISENVSIAASGPVAHVLWDDNRDGNYEIYYKRDPTGNSDVEEGLPLLLTPYASRLTVSPNPFTSFATIPGHASERFFLFDISGRKVGVYKGERIGEGLSPGVYFLRREGGRDAKPLRIVKLR
jgi:hypothetical protein